MYKGMMRITATLYAFLSGLMVSLATSAAAEIAFAESVPPNQQSILTRGGVALLAGLFWFFLSENISAAVRHVDDLAPALGNRDAAIDSLSPQTKVSGVIYLCIALICSFLWPWV